MRTPWIIAIAAAAVIDTTGALGQQPTCATREAALNVLAKNHKEAPAFVGLSASGYMVEVLTSDDRATWTILMSQPDGKRTCLVDAGENWQPVESNEPQEPHL